MHEATCQDRLAELQSEIFALPSALTLAKLAWDTRKDALTRKATRAVRKIASHVLGVDRLGQTATAEDARNAFEGKLLQVAKLNSCKFKTETELLDTRPKSISFTQPVRDDLPDKDTPPEEVAAFFNFWICAEQDRDFAAWVATYTRKEELARLAERSPRVRLGLAPAVADALPLSVKLGPPRRVAGYLVPTKLTERTEQPTKEPGWIHHKATERFEEIQDQDPAREPPGDVPPFKCRYDSQTQTLELDFPELEYTPQPTQVLEDADSPPVLGVHGVTKQTRGQFADTLVEILKALPPIPKGAMDPWFVLRRLAETKLQNAQTQGKKAKAARTRDKIERLVKDWPLSQEALPIPRVFVYTPNASWVDTLEVIAEDCTPSLEFAREVFTEVLPLGAIEDPPQDTPEDNKHRNRAWELEALHSTWGLLNNALKLCGFTAVSFEDYKADQESHTRLVPSVKDPLRCNAAWSRWQHALWKNFLESPDDLVPATLGVLDWLARDNPNFCDALRWSAEAASWAGKPVHSDPDGMWCTYRKIQLRLGKLPTLPTKIL